MHTYAGLTLGLCVGDAVFQRIGNGLVGGHLVPGYIAVLLQNVKAAYVGALCRLESLEHFLLVALGKSFQCEVGKYDGSRIAYHTVGLVAHKMPYGQTALLAVDVEECLHEVALHVGE